MSRKCCLSWKWLLAKTTKHFILLLIAFSTPGVLGFACIKIFHYSSRSVCNNAKNLDAWQILDTALLFSRSYSDNVCGVLLYFFLNSSYFGSAHVYTCFGYLCLLWLFLNRVDFQTCSSWNAIDMVKEQKEDLKYVPLTYCACYFM